MSEWVDEAECKGQNRIRERGDAETMMSK